MLSDIKKNIDAFKVEAHGILSIHEASPSRKVILDNTYNKLKNLSLNQDEMLKQALRCVEHDLYRAAYILSWIALIDLIEEKLASDNFIKLNQARPKWNITSLDDLREKQNEYSILEASRVVGLISKGDMRILVGYLNERHQCAHPTNFYPNFNQTLGYIANILYRIEVIQIIQY